MIIHHVGVVELLDEYRVLNVLRMLGPVWLVGEKEVEEWGCLCRVFRVGNGEALFEMVHPLRDGPLMNWYQERKGASLHHMAIRVDSCLETSRRLQNWGLRLVSPVPVEGAMGWMVNFVHPEACGVLIELVEEPR